jgi:hypothetical protein
MTRRRLFYLAATLLWLLLLGFVAKVSLDRLAVPPWGNDPASAESLELTGEAQAGQAFTAPFPGLYRVEVGLTQAAANPDQTVVLHLKAGPAAPGDLWTATLRAGDLPVAGFYSFEFSPRRDSQGQGYYFSLEAPGAAPGQGVAVGYSPASVLQGASAYLDGQPVDGNLQFRTFYTLRTRDKVRVLLSRMATGRPYLLGSPGFYVALAGIYLLVLAAFLIQVARVALREEEEES